MTSESPENKMAASLGIEGATSEEKSFVLSAMQKIATRILATRLEERLGAETKHRLAALIEAEDIDEVARLLREEIPDFDELRVRVIEEARYKVLAKADEAKRDPGNLPRILNERIADGS